MVVLSNQPALQRPSRKASSQDEDRQIKEEMGERHLGITWLDFWHLIEGSFKSSGKVGY